MPRARLLKKSRKMPKLVTLEVALAWLRRGTPIRRRGWHPESRIFRLGGDVFVKLPSSVFTPPQFWRPYPNDVLATDWMRA